MYRFCMLIFFISLLDIIFCASVYAVPAFAHKYNLDCTVCHTMTPRLTAFGYEFMRNGFRISDDDPKPSKLQQMASFLAEAHSTHTTVNLPDGHGTSRGDMEVFAAGPIGEKVSARAVYKFNPDDRVTKFGQFYLQYNTAISDHYISVRAGQIPVLSGIRQSATPSITVMNPLLFGDVDGTHFGRATPFDDNTIFSLGGLERGVEVAASSHGLTLRGSWLVGVNEGGEGDEALPGRRGNDYVVQLEKLLDKRGSSVSAFYYKGRTPHPFLHFDNTFNRSGIFANHIWHLRRGRGEVPALSCELLGAYTHGTDLADAAGNKMHDHGSLLEGDLYVHNRLAYIVRYDTNRQSDLPGAPPTTKQLTGGIAYLANRSVRLGIDLSRDRGPNVTTLIGSMSLMY